MARSATKCGKRSITPALHCLCSHGGAGTWGLSIESLTTNRVCCEHNLGHLKGAETGDICCIAARAQEPLHWQSNGDARDAPRNVTDLSRGQIHKSRAAVHKGSNNSLSPTSTSKHARNAPFSRSGTHAVRLCEGASHAPRLSRTMLGSRDKALARDFWPEAKYHDSEADQRNISTGSRCRGPAHQYVAVPFAFFAMQRLMCA